MEYIEDNYIEEDEPTYEAEYCTQCEKIAIENDYEYEFNVTWKNDHWVCDNCGCRC